MKKIYLNRDKRAFALVDDADYDELNKHHWMLKSDGYAYRQKCKGKKSILNLLMHHQIMGKPQEGFEIDHINRKPLDNRRSNLRFVTHQQNMINRPTQKNNTTGYPGIRRHSFISKDGNPRWQAEVKRHGKNVYIGLFKTIEEAWSARQLYLEGRK